MSSSMLILFFINSLFQIFVFIYYRMDDILKNNHLQNISINIYKARIFRLFFIIYLPIQEVFLLFLNIRGESHFYFTMFFCISSLFFIIAAYYIKISIEYQANFFFGLLLLFLANTIYHSITLVKPTSLNILFSITEFTFVLGLLIFIHTNFQKFSIIAILLLFAVGIYNILFKIESWLLFSQFFITTVSIPLAYFNELLENNKKFNFIKNLNSDLFKKNYFISIDNSGKIDWSNNISFYYKTELLGKKIEFLEKKKQLTKFENFHIEKKNESNIETVSLWHKILNFNNNGCIIAPLDITNEYNKIVELNNRKESLLNYLQESANIILILNNNLVVIDSFIDKKYSKFLANDNFFNKYIRFIELPNKLKLVDANFDLLELKLRELISNKMQINFQLKCIFKNNKSISSLIKLNQCYDVDNELKIIISVNFLSSNESVFEKKEDENNLEVDKNSVANSFSNTINKRLLLDTIKKTSNSLNYLIENDDLSIKKIKSIALELQKLLPNPDESFDIWNEFLIEFQSENPTFFKKLKEINKKISINEMKHCAFIVSLFNVKEIANMSNISVRSVEAIRYRIKKKLNVEQNENIYEFLINLINM